MEKSELLWSSLSHTYDGHAEYEDMKYQAKRKEQKFIWLNATQKQMNC